MMDIPIEDVRDICVIAQALIVTLEQQIAIRGVTEGNVPIDAVISCLCYAIKQADPRLEDAELIRRVSKYYEALDLEGAPGTDKGS